jgi:hypothetical protein
MRRGDWVGVAYLIALLAILIFPVIWFWPW